MIGQEYIYEGKIEICRSGFHACTELIDCFKYYAPVPWNKIAEVELSGKILLYKEDSKKCANKIKIIKELNWEEILNDISGGNDISGCLSCEGISRCIFCLNFTGKLAIFNKQVTEMRYVEVKEKIDNFNWQPTFNNLEALYLKSGNRWEYTPIPRAEETSKQEAWADMPQNMLDYIKSLPEFDAQIFIEITGKE